MVKRPVVERFSYCKADARHLRCMHFDTVSKRKAKPFLHSCVWHRTHTGIRLFLNPAPHDCARAAARWIYFWIQDQVGQLHVTIFLARNQS
jgi:hypothetical protein